MIDDTQIWLVPDDPFAFRIEARHAGEAAIIFGDFHPSPTVEDAAADIDFVVEDALAPFRLPESVVGFQIPLLYLPRSRARGEGMPSALRILQIWRGKSELDMLVSQ